MDVLTKGFIRSREYMQQIKDFKGLEYGSCRPTDIDFCLDLKNKLFVFGELKHGNTGISTGQRIAAERIVKACEKSVSTYFFVASHNTSGDIDVKNAIVKSYFHNGRWTRTPEITVKSFIDSLGEVKKWLNDFLIIASGTSRGSAS